MESKLRFGCQFRFHKWIVFLSALLVYSHIIGFFYAHGALFPTIMDKFGVTRAKASLIQSVYAASLYGGGVLHGTLTDKLGPKWTGLLGGILTSTGLFVSFLSSSLAPLVVFLGAIKGSGAGLCMVSTSLAVRQHFTGKLCVVVLSVLVSGASLGGMELIYLVRYLSDIYGLNGTLLILTGLDMNCAVLALLWKPPMDEKSADEISDKSINNADKQSKPGDIISNININTKNEHATKDDLDNLGRDSATKTKDLPERDYQSEKGTFEFEVNDGQSSCQSSQTDREFTEEIEIHDKVTHHVYINKILVNDTDNVFNDDATFERTFTGRKMDNPISHQSGTVKTLFNYRSEENADVKHWDNKDLKPDNSNFKNNGQLSTSQNEEDSKDSTRSNATEYATLTFKQKMKNMLSVKSFVFILIGLALSLNVSLMFIVFIVDIIMDKGYSEDQGTVGLTILTIASVLGCLTHGTLLPCPFDTTFILPITATGLSSLAMVILALADNLAVYYVLSCILGNGLGVVVSVIVVTTSQIMEVQYLPYAIGTLVTVTGLSNLAAGPIAGAIRDVTGTYTMSVLIAAGVNTIGMFMFILAQRFHTKKNFIL